MHGRSTSMRLAFAVLAALLAGPVAAQRERTPVSTYPDRPIRMIVPVTPGGGTDIVGRLVAAYLVDSLGQQIVVDNRPGAGTVIGAEIVARAAPDGYTLLVAFASFTTIPHLTKSLPYDPLRSFTPITQVATSPLLLIVPASLGVGSVADLIAFAKSRAQTFTVGAASPGSAVHVSAEQFKLATGLTPPTVIYKGAGPAMVALLSGEVQMMFSTVPAALPFHKQGKVKLVATNSRQRLSYVPDVPTLEEGGLKGIDVAPWQGLLGPAGLPRGVVERLHGEVVKMLQKPDFKERLAATGSDPVGSTPAEFAAFLQREYEQLGRIIRAAGIKGG